MKATSFRLSRSYGGEWELTARLTGDSVKEAMNLCDKQKDREYDVTIKEHRDKRSLTANAYFHVLCTKMAAVMQSDIESVKRLMVCRYGVVAEKNGDPVIIKLPKGMAVENFYPYSEWMYGDQFGDTYMLYKQTHTMNTAEFGRLIDGTVEEAKELGIETLPPDELRRLYAQIDKGV